MSKYTMSSGKDAYSEWANSQGDLPLYMNTWWLDIVSGEGDWSAVLVSSSNGQVVGALPYTTKKRYGLSVIIPPMMTAYSGPWIFLKKDSRRTYIKAKHRYWEILDRIIQGLPTSAIQIIQTSPDIDDWLPFHWKGFRQTTRYTFLLEDISDPEACYEGFKGNIRTNIRKAESKLKVIKSNDVNALYDIHNQSFISQGSTSPIPRQLLIDLYNAAASRGQANIHLAIDQNQTVYAGTMTFKDCEKAYILISGVDRSKGNIGALNLLYWHVIQYYSKDIKVIDFEGSMLEGVAPVFLAFGAKMYPYHRLIRYKNKAIEIAAVMTGKGV